MQNERQVQATPIDPEHPFKMTMDQIREFEKDVFISAGPPPRDPELLQAVAEAAEFYLVNMFTVKNSEGIKKLRAALKAAGLKHESR